nr:MAG TPA: hypothetical protein [Caudoviricetes sp.]
MLCAVPKHLTYYIRKTAFPPPVSLFTVQKLLI